MSLAHAVLGILDTGPGHGYDIKRVYDERFAGSRPLAYGQVYATLARLQRDDLAEVAEVLQEGGPERTTYAITEGGRQVLQDWLGAVEAPGPYPAEELVRKTVTALQLGVDAAEFLGRQRAAHLAGMRGLLRQQAEATDAAARIALDHAVFHLDADLRWLEAAAERVGHPRRGQSG